MLHGLRLKGFAPVTVLAPLAACEESYVTFLLAQLLDEGLVQYREGAVTGWWLTPSGRRVDADMCAAEVAAAGAAAGLSAAYERFLALNHPFLAVCTDWQMVSPPGRAQTVNAHDDEEYDAAVIARLGQLDDAVQPVCADVAALLPRLTTYSSRLAEARRRVEAGELDWFTAALIDSYHTVWFELHEDLLATLGLSREEEATG